MKIDHLIDQRKPGFLKSGVMLKPSEFLEAARRGLKSASGKNIGLIEPSVDPLSTTELRKAAPQDLQQSVTMAEKRLEESRELTGKLFDRWSNARTAMAKFQKDWFGAELTPKGMNRRDELLRAIAEAERNYRDSEDAESLARAELLRAQIKLDAWCRIERARREHPEPPLTSDQTLGDRLKALKDKLA